MLARDPIDQLHETIVRGDAAAVSRALNQVPIISAGHERTCSELCTAIERFRDGNPELVVRVAKMLAAARPNAVKEGALRRLAKIAEWLRRDSARGKELEAVEDAITAIEVDKKRKPGTWEV